MKKFSQFLYEQLLTEAPLGGPSPSPGGISSPASLPPGGTPPLGGGLGAPSSPLGGVAGAAGPTTNTPPVKLKSPDVWHVLEKLLNIH